MHSSVHRIRCQFLACVIALGCVACAAAADPIALDLQESWPIDHATHHVQGLCVTADTFFISSVERATKSGFVYRVDRKTLRVEKEERIAIGDQYHPGGMQLAGGRLWVPLAEYRAKSTSTILALDPATLKTVTSFALDDHIGALAASGRGELLAGNWDCRVIYRLDEKGKVLDKVDSPTGVAYQDFELHDRLLWAAGRLKEDKRLVPVVDVIDTSNWKLQQRYTLRGELRSGGTDFCREGFCKFGDDLYVMPEDGPKTTIYRFALPAAK
jgi:hypothetical protein